MGCAKSNSAAIDGIIAAIDAQAVYLKSKPSWTRKMVLVTDGQSPLELDSWEMTADKIKELNIQLSILYVPTLPS